MVKLMGFVHSYKLFEYDTVGNLKGSRFTCHVHVIRI